MPSHCSEATKRQGGLDATGIPYLQDPVEGGLQGAVLVCWEPAEEDPQGLYLAQLNALQGSSEQPMFTVRSILLHAHMSK